MAMEYEFVEIEGVTVYVQSMFIYGLISKNWFYKATAEPMDIDGPRRHWIASDKNELVARQKAIEACRKAFLRASKE